MKHKIYTDGETLNQLIKDYPIFEPCMIYEGEMIISMEATEVNDIIGYEFCNNGDMLDSRLVNSILDELENQGKIH